MSFSRATSSLRPLPVALWAVARRHRSRRSGHGGAVAGSVPAPGVRPGRAGHWTGRPSGGGDVNRRFGTAFAALALVGAAGGGGGGPAPPNPASQAPAASQGGAASPAATTA